MHGTINIKYCTKLTQRNTAPFAKLIVIHTVNKFPTFYGTQKFITLFTRTHHHAPA